jgi:hypothetical protein
MLGTSLPASAWFDFDQSPTLKRRDQHGDEIGESISAFASRR